MRERAGGGVAGSGLTFKLFGEDVNASKALDDLQGNAKKVAGAIGAAFGAVKISDAISDGFDNQKVIDKMTAGLGQTPEVAKQAGEIAGQLYRDGLGESLDEVTNAVGAVGTSMGDLSQMAPDQIARITTSAQAVATVMGTDVTEVTRAAGQMFKNGLAPSAEAALDMIAKGATDGTNASGDMLDSFTEFGSAFHTVGIDGPMAMAMVKSSMDAGAFSTDLATNAVNEFATRSLDGSTGTVEAFQALGFNADEMAQKIAGGGPAATEAMSQVMTALSNMHDPVAQEAAGVALFGTQFEDAGAAAILAMNPATQAVVDASGAAQEMGETLADNGATKVEVFKRGMDGLVQAASNLDGPMGDVVAGVMAFGPSAMAAGAAAMSFVGWIKEAGIATKLATAGQWLLNVAMSANPIALIIIAIVALVAGFIWLWNNVEGFRNFFIAAWDMIKAAFQIVIDAIVWYFTTYWNIISTIFTTFISLVMGAWEGIKAGASAVGEWVSNAFSTAVGFVTGLFSSIGAFISGVWDGIKNGVASAAQWVSDKWQAAVDFVVNIFSNIGSFLSGVWDGVTSAVTGVGETIKNAFKSAVDFVMGIFGGIGGAMQGAFSGIGNFLKTPINGAINAINWAIDQINRISFDIPDWVPFVGGNHFGISLPHLPTLAQGGVAMPRSGGYPAIIGDGNQPEAIVPLSKWGDMTGGSGGGPATVVHITVQGAVVGTTDQLARVVVDAMSGARRRGMLPANALAGLAG